MLFSKNINIDIVYNNFLSYDFLLKFFSSFFRIFFYSFLYLVFLISGVANEFVFSKIFKSYRSSFFVVNHVVSTKSRSYLKGRMTKNFFYLCSILLPGFQNNANLDYFRQYVSLQTTKNNHLIYAFFKKDGLVFFLNDVVTRVLNLNVISIKKDDVFFKINLPRLNYRFFFKLLLLDNSKYMKKINIEHLYLFIFSYFGYNFMKIKSSSLRNFHFYSRII